MDLQWQRPYQSLQVSGDWAQRRFSSKEEATLTNWKVSNYDPDKIKDKHKISWILQKITKERVHY